MDKLKKCIFIVLNNTIASLTNARFYVAVILVTCLMNQIAYPIRVFSIQTGINTCPWIFPFVTQTYYMQMIILLGIVFLFCDLPIIHNGTAYILVRAGKRIWFWSQVMYIFVMTFIYNLVIFVLSITLFLPYIKIENNWGKILGTVAQTNLGDQLGVEIDYLLQVTYTPAEAISRAFLIVFLVGAFTGIVILFLNVYFQSIVGAIVGTIIAFTPYFSANANNMSTANYISPAVWLNIMNSYQLESVSYPNAMYIFSFLIGGIILFTIFAYLRVRNNKYSYLKVTN
ncbi:hypothetical protein [Anaerotignum sp.]